MLQEIKSIFIEIFTDLETDISMATVAADVPGWDSLGHLKIMMAIEKKFKIRLTATEISSLNSVGDIVELVALKYNAK
jgi:acyl carrier protein